MLKTVAFTTTRPLILFSAPKPPPQHTAFLPKFRLNRNFLSSSSGPAMNIFNKLGFGPRAANAAASPESSAAAQAPDDDVPAPGQAFAQFGAGCFWGVELAFQRVPGVTRTEVGYSQGLLANPTYEDICTGTSGHSEVVRVQYDPSNCSYDDLLAVFWARHDPTTLNRQVSLTVDCFL